MPATRRTRTTSSGPAAKGAQKTLSFGNKVSKPSTAFPYTKDSPAKDVLTADISSTPEAHPLSKKTVEVESEVEEELQTGHVDPTPAVTRQGAVEIRALRKKDGGDLEAVRERAEKVTDAQIKKYWRVCEGQRRGKQVHAEDVGVEEKILRLFDVSSQFGPAIGIARTKRWSRAQKLKLNPPIEVLAVLLREEKKGNEKIQRAYVDELMSSKFVNGDAS
ncbi:hypothetical protein WAI453_002144 [Rhynchosporium graminicola]